MCMRHSLEHKRVWAVTLPETKDGSFSSFTSCAHLGERRTYLLSQTYPCRCVTAHLVFNRHAVASPPFFLFPVAPPPPSTSSLQPCNSICSHHAITKPLENAQQNKEIDWRLSLALRPAESRRFFESVGFSVGDEDPFTDAFSSSQLVLKRSQLVCRVDDLSRAPARASGFSALIQLDRNWEGVHPILLPKRNHFSSSHTAPPLCLRRHSCLLCIYRCVLLCPWALKGWFSLACSGMGCSPNDPVGSSLYCTVTVRFMPGCTL